MMQYSSDCGLSAYWMLHSPTMPRWRATLMATERSFMYSALESVCDGATTIESPVWMPSGSKFSMLQTVMQLSLQSRTTSYSISFHPFIDRSTSTCGELMSACVASARALSSSCAKPEPSPPSAKAARMMTGKPIFAAIATASSTVDAGYPSAMRSLISVSLALKISRSSVAMIASTGVPSTRTPNSARTPFLSRATPQLRAVWPPNWSRMPSGRSLSMTERTTSGVTGRK
mmetsp:Transcript_44485/g.143027  ORF Transcript_44485/g.143027 Transcript_44485/m.143027 type:complete len:231 (-) Transcript_44485:1071-1763(-)